ncbi:TlpA family protein disulfide reductase [Mucilaginibacter lutimaris]|uniref:TlpA family protein disulfide reductase n=1 Tax=Mucilaginibacter lutimaris TaxID=931629 RepID=A0ABW2ZKF0_9SPHI
MNLQASKILTRSNLVNGLLIALFLLVLFVPSVKGLFIRGLMKVGFFQPDIAQTIDTPVMLPPVIFEGADGHMLNLQGQRGKVVFINFWATWCPPCVAEMPSINELYGKLKDNKNIVFIMVDADGDFNKSALFMLKHNYTMPLYRVTGNFPESLFKGTLPTTVIFDKQGKMVFRHEGSADYGGTKVSDYLQQLAK